MRKFMLVVAVFAWTSALAVAGTATAVTSHCGGHDDDAFTKIQGQGTHVVGDLVVIVDGETVSFEDEFGNPVEVVFCVKASTGVSGEITGSSFTVNWLNGGGQIPDISYVVVYELFCDPYYGCGGNEGS